MHGLTPEQEDSVYQLVLKRIEVLMDAKPGTPEGAELEFLSVVAESYEERRFPMRQPASEN